MAQARKKSRPVLPATTGLVRRLRESLFLLSVLAAVYLTACLLSYDPNDPGPFNTVAADRVHNLGRVLGAWLANFLLFLSGYIAYLLPLLIVYGGWLVYAERDEDPQGRLAEWTARVTGFVLFILAGTGLAQMHSAPAAGAMPAGGGGVIGMQTSGPLIELSGPLGATLFLLALAIVGFTLFTGISWFHVMDVIGKATLGAGAWLLKGVSDMRDWFAGRRAKAQREVTRKAEKQRRKTRPKPRIEPQLEPAVVAKPSQRVAKEKQRPLFENLPESMIPPLELLDEPPEQQAGYSTEALEALSRQVELKLADFGVQVDVVAVHPGPVITRFELQPAPGVKSAQIMNLAKDLARGLSVVSVRVVEVIPGKPTIGLEIPNQSRQIVYLSEILRSEAYDNSKSSLTLALGKGIQGRPMVADLARMPHLLVAGTTGSGKSVALNAMILSLVY